jgi:hypothetical protein
MIDAVELIPILIKILYFVRGLFPKASAFGAAPNYRF